MPSESISNNIDVLPPDYYLKNFLTLLKYVHEQYKDLLRPDEKDLVKDFRRLSVDSQKLYVRLISRKGPYFRTDKLKYSEIKDISGAIKELEKREFLSVNPRAELEMALQVFTKPELIMIVKEIRPGNESAPSSGDGKQVWFDHLLEMEEKSIWEFIEIDHQLLVPGRVDDIALYFLLFFGNMEQSLSDFILEEIGVLRYESYKIRKEDLLFQERRVVDDFLAIYTSRTILWEAIEKNDLNSVMQLGKWFREFEPHESMKRKVYRSFNDIGIFLERHKEWELALDYFNQSQLPPARERRARILEKTGRIDESLQTTEEILAQPFDEVEEEFARRFGAKLKKHLGLPFETIKREQFPTEELILERIPGLHIETYVANQLLSRGKLGFHSENGIWTALFGLVFWDIVFMPLSGVFFNPFQRGPADLFTDDFKKRRELSLEERITELNEMNEWEKMILAMYDDKYNTANHLVPWKRISREQIKQMISWVPKKDILCILERMSGKLKEFRSGFPDLVVYEPAVKKYCLMEVKGPGDQLRPNQKRWLRFFEEKEIPYKVLRVKWIN